MTITNENKLHIRLNNSKSNSRGLKVERIKFFGTAPSLQFWMSFYYTTVRKSFDFLAL